MHPRGEAPEQRDDHRQDGEDGKRVRVQPGRQERPAAGGETFGVGVHEVDERRADEGEQPDARRQPDLQARPALADAPEQAMAGFGRCAPAHQPGEERGEDERRGDLGADQEEGVVARAGRRQRRDVQRPVDPRRGAVPENLGHEDQKTEGRDPSPPHPPMILPPSRGKVMP